MDKPDTPKSLAFGPFVLDLATRTLLARGEKVTLSSRGFDILALLVAEHGRVVGKDEIIATVWRGLAVEENNLAVQISSLRRALAEHAEGQTIILTVPGQGYRFVAKLDAPAEPPPAISSTPDAIPPELSAMLPGIGLAEATRARRPLSHWSIAVIPVLALAAWLGWHFQGTKEPPRLSIAVLPFRNLSEDRSQDYLADAISDDLTTDLAHLPGSVVIARESSDVYKGHAAPAQQIGRALNVRYLLEGSLRPVENTFSVNAQLIDASNGSHLWATQFSVPRDKLQDAQVSIVGNIGSALQVKLVEVESKRSLKERPTNPDAEDLLLRARSIHDRAKSPAELLAAQKLLEQALKLAPDYAAAMTELALVLQDKTSEFEEAAGEEARDTFEAGRLAEKALSITPDDDRALTAKGLQEVTTGHIDRADATFSAALAINPNNPVALAGHINCSVDRGKVQAASDALQREIEIDPKGQKATHYRAMQGYTYVLLGKFQDAKESLQRSLAESSDAADTDLGTREWCTLFLMAAYELSGDTIAARKLYSEYKVRWKNRTIWRLSAFQYKPLVDTVGFQDFERALSELGMKRFASQADLPKSVGDRQGAFDPPPTHIPGSQSIMLTELETIRKSSPQPLVVDVGNGAAMLPEAHNIQLLDAPSGGLADVLRLRKAGSPVVIIGSGWFGWDGALAAQKAVQMGVEPVYLLLGGEETLASSTDPTVFNSMVP